MTWVDPNVDVFNNFATTGDSMKNSVPDLETVINAGVGVYIIVLNWNMNTGSFSGV